MASGYRVKMLNFSWNKCQKHRWKWKTLPNSPSNGLNVSSANALPAHIEFIEPTQLKAHELQTILLFAPAANKKPYRTPLLLADNSHRQTSTTNQMVKSNKLKMHNIRQHRIYTDQRYMHLPKICNVHTPSTKQTNKQTEQQTANNYFILCCIFSLVVPFSTVPAHTSSLDTCVLCVPFNIQKKNRRE